MNNLLGDNRLITTYSLNQNYPNPFNPATTIRYDVPENAHTKITIYDITGRLVTTLVDKKQVAGHYSIEWDASNFGNGTYFCKMEARTEDGAVAFRSVKKLILLM